MFYKRGFIERWGTGTLRMLELCKERGLPEPEFSEYSGGISVIFRFKSSIGPHDYTRLNETEEDDTTILIGREDSTYVLIISARQRKILVLLSEYGEMKPKDILAKLENSIPARTLRYDLKKLKDMKIVDSRGKAQQTTWFLLP